MANAVIASRSGCTITVTDRIHFVQGKDVTDYDFMHAVKNIKEQLKKTWEDPEFRWKCCKVKFKFDYVKEAADDADDKNLVMAPGRSHQHLGPEKGAGTWYLDPDGFIPGTCSCPAAAHEAGHELGAPDQYEPVNAHGDPTWDSYWDDSGQYHVNPAIDHYEPKAGYPRDGLMFNSKTGAPQSVDIDAIMTALKAECPDRCCGK